MKIKNTHEGSSNLMPSPTLRPERGMAGFTLVELVVVIIITGIVAVTALPRITGNTLEDAAFKEEVKAAIEYARKTAISRRRYTCVDIQTTSVTLTAELVAPESHAGSCNYTALDLPSVGGNVITAPQNVTISPATTIMFDAAGMTATAKTTFTVAAPASSMTFVMETGSGYVHD